MKPARSHAALEAIREGILDQALELIDEEGFAAFTMRGLARRLGMTAPNLYNFFRGKEEIYITLMVKGFATLEQHLRSAGERRENPEARARAFMRAYLQFGFENKRHYDLMFAARTPKHRDYVGTPYEQLSADEHAVSMRVVDLTAGVVDEFARSRGVRLKPAERRRLLAGAWALLHGLVSLTNSRNLAYVAGDAEKAVFRIADDVLDAAMGLNAAL